jgi:CBS domain-containing protein
MVTGIKVKEIMVTRVITAKPDDTVHEAAKKMRDEDVGSVIVIDDKKPVGIATREDVVNKVVAEDLKASEVLVREIMNQPLIVCNEDDDIAEAARTMTKYGYERLPVVNKDNKLIGIISVREILRVAPTLIEIFKERLEMRGEVVEEESMDEGGYCERCGNYSEELYKVNDMWICEECKEQEE